MIIKYHQFINESKNDPIPELNQDKIGIVLMGTPGLGKTHFNKNYIQTKKQIKTFSTDDVSLRFTKDPNKYYDGSSDLNIKMLLTFMDSGNSFIYDTTGTHPDQIFKIVQKAKKLSYKIIFIHLVGPLELSLKQNQIRDRQVDPEYIRFSYQNQFPNMKTYSSQLSPDAYYIIYKKDNKYKFYKYKDGNILKRKVDKYLKEQNERDNYFNDYLDSNSKRMREEDKNVDDYYKLISYDDACKLIFGLKDFEVSDSHPREDKRIHFTKNEINSIKSILEDKYKISVEIYKHFNRASNSDNTNQTITASRPKVGKELFRYDIWKLEDEWYIVKMGDIATSIYYQCDQFEGLLKLLNKTKISVNC